VVGAGDLSIAKGAADGGISAGVAGGSVSTGAADADGDSVGGGATAGAGAFMAGGTVGKTAPADFGGVPAPRRARVKPTVDSRHIRADHALPP
jgi:hypothetical protein